MAKFRSPEWTRLNKKLTIPNIVITVLALAAMLIHLFVPFLDWTISVDASKYAPIIEQIIPSGEEGGDQSGSGSNDESAAMMDAMMGMITDTLGDLPVISVRIKTEPLKMLNAGIGDAKAVGEFIVSVIDEKQITEMVNDVVQSIVPSTLSGFVSMMCYGETPIPEAKVAEYKTASVNIFSKLESSDIDGAKADFSALCVTMMNDAYPGEETSQEMLDMATGMFDKIVGWGVVDGVFSYENLLANIDLESLMGGEGDGDPAAPAEAAPDGDDFADDSAAMPDFGAILADPAGYIASLFTEGEALDGIKLGLLIGFIALSAFPAALWFILALAAFTHIFRKNKKVGMWYVKLVCIWTCIIFVILPAVAVGALPMLMKMDFVAGALGSAGAGAGAGGMAITAEMLIEMVSAVTLSCAGAGLWTGILYFALWAISIFWCHPIKRQIKREVKRLKAIAKAEKRAAKMAAKQA